MPESDAASQFSETGSSVSDGTGLTEPDGMPMEHASWRVVSFPFEKVGLLTYYYGIF